MPDSQRRSFLLSPWLPLLIGVLCMINSTFNSFTYDDIPLIAGNPRIHNLGDAKAIWLSNWWAAAGQSPDVNIRRDPLYRPFTHFTLALDYALHGLRPAGFHLVNVLLHGIACAVLWLLARRLTGDPAVASVAAVLFAIHPVHAEAVANVVGRAEILAALFLMLGSLVLLPRNGQPGIGRGLAATGLFFVALMSKETAICYPAIGLLVLYAGSRGRKTRLGWWLMHAAVLILPLLIYFPMRYVALGGRLFRGSPAGSVMNSVVLADGSERIWAALTVFGHYVRLLIVPATLSSDYGLAVIDPRQGFTPMTALGLVAAIGLIIGLVGFVRGGRRWRLVAILCGLWLASYALISNTVLLIGVTAAERLMYWPSVIAMILAAVGLVAFWRRFCAERGSLASSARVLRVLAVVFVVTLGLRTMLRNYDWHDNLRLLQTDVRTYPQSAQIQRGLARSLLDVAEITPEGEGRTQRVKWADAAAERALKIEPSFVPALVIRAQTHEMLDDIDAAFLYAETAFRLDPHNEHVQEVLARLQGVGDIDRQLETQAQRVAESPQDANVRLDYGRALLTYGRPVSAAEQLQRAVELAPDNLTALRLLSQALAGSGKVDEARRVCKQVLARDPNDWETQTNLAYLTAGDDPQEALKHAQRAAELKPDDLRVRINLAETFAAAGQKQHAIELFQRLLHDLDADDPYRSVVRSKIDDLRN